MRAFLEKVFIFNSPRGIYLTGYKEEIIYSEGGETLEQVAQTGSGGSIPGNLQGQVGRGSE